MGKRKRGATDKGNITQTGQKNLDAPHVKVFCAPETRRDSTARLALFED